MSNPYAQRESLRLRIYNINDLDFTRVALDVFHYQFEQNPVYRQYVEALSVSPISVNRIDEIPFLPITMFRDHVIKSGLWEAAAVFSSSGTTGTKPGMHYVRDLAWYHKIAELNISRIFGSPSDFTWIGLLPSYLDRPGSSLVNMVQSFMQKSGRKENGFYPDINQELIEKLQRLADAKSKVALIGVSFALLDLFEQNQIPVWDHLLVIETGGMKGRREEITR
ncbi:MAG TPA: hypothetical protein VJ508_09165, partial [Saprospiraceae bacterium]|nr:hypothetical protein [Saprospiraceae bacterium]